MRTAGGNGVDGDHAAAGDVAENGVAENHDDSGDAMSLILDALKKAERQRDLAEPPALRLAAAAPRRERRPLLALLLTLAGVAAGALAVLAFGTLTPPAVETVPPAAATGPSVAIAARRAAAGREADAAGAPRQPVAQTAPRRVAAATATATAAALRVDIHAYSAEPSKRFVLINGRRYQQGDRLAEGPLLQRISADGVELDDAGRRVELRVK